MIESCRVSNIVVWDFFFGFRLNRFFYFERNTTSNLVNRFFFLAKDEDDMMCVVLRRLQQLLTNIDLPSWFCTAWSSSSTSEEYFSNCLRLIWSVTCLRQWLISLNILLGECLNYLFSWSSLFLFPLRVRILLKNVMNFYKFRFVTYTSFMTLLLRQLDFKISKFKQMFRLPVYSREISSEWIQKQWDWLVIWWVFFKSTMRLKNVIST
jgi:hypothetical protein